MAFRRLFIPSAKLGWGRFRTAITGRRISCVGLGGASFGKPPFLLSATISKSVTVCGGSMKKALFEGFDSSFGLGNYFFVVLLYRRRFFAVSHIGNFSGGSGAPDIVKALDEYGEGILHKRFGLFNLGAEAVDFRVYSVG